MKKKKIALITGITGQDGAYLAKLLLKKIIKYLELKEEPQQLILQELTTYIKRTLQIKKQFYFKIWRRHRSSKYQ